MPELSAISGDGPGSRMNGERAWTVAAWAVLGFHLAAIVAVSGLQPGGGLRDRFLPDDAAVRALLEEAEIFGSSEPLAILVEPVDSEQWPGLLLTLEGWARELESLPGIAAATGPQDLAVLDWTADHRPTLRRVADQDQPAASLALHPLARAGFVRRDGRGAAILLDLDRELAADFSARAETYRALESWRMGKRERERLSIVGVLALEQRTAELALRDSSRLTGLLVAGVLVVLIVTLRSIALAFACVAVALLNVVSTFGVAAALGILVSPLSFAVAPIVLSIGLLDNVHIAYAFARLRGRCTAAEAVASTRSRLWAPCAWTTVTTVAALGVLVMSPVPQVRQFGLLGAIGTAIALATSLALLPQAFARLSTGVGKRSFGATADSEQWVRLYRSRWPLAGALILVVCLAPGLTSLRLVAEYPRVFGDDHEITETLERIETQWGGVATVTFLLTPKSGHAVHDDAVLERVRDFHSLLGGRELVTGIASPFALAATGLESYRSRFRTRPLEQRRRELLDGILSEQSGSSRWYDPATDTYRIVARVRMMQPQSFAQLDQDLRGLAAGLDEFFDVRLSGWPLAYKNLEKTLLRELATSMGWAAAMVALLILVALRDLRLWSAAIVVNAVPVIVVLGALGTFDLGFSTALLLVPGLALGLIVDDTLHTGLALRAAESRSADISATALRGVRTPLAITSAVLIFLALGLLGSEFAMNRSMGAVLAPIIALAWIADALLLPSLLDLFNKRS